MTTSIETHTKSSTHSHIECPFEQPCHKSINVFVNNINSIGNCVVPISDLANRGRYRITNHAQWSLYRKVSVYLNVTWQVWYDCLALEWGRVDVYCKGNRAKCHPGVAASEEARVKVSECAGERPWTEYTYHRRDKPTRWYGLVPW